MPITMFIPAHTTVVLFIYSLEAFANESLHSLTVSFIFFASKIAPTAAMTETIRPLTPVALENAALQSFLQVCTEIQKALDIEKERVKNLQTKYDQLLVSATEEQRTRLESEIAPVQQSTDTVLIRIRNELKSMDKENREKRGAVGLTPETRIRINMTSALSRKFMDLLQQYRGIEQVYRTKTRETLARQIRIVNPNATQDEIEEVIRDPSRKQVFADRILDRDQVAAQIALNEMKDRAQDVKRLEASMEQVLTLFQDMALLVESQGELLDTVEVNVEQAQGYTETAAHELHAARTSQKSATRKKVIIIILVILGIVAVCGIVLGPTLGVTLS
mmetsp:Transcript_6914/g.10883  ORF Transcript_6914/g.10883 Transcript_6914/m.10883 type:complete len:333 (-) Transcript_6914:57-1055(-)